MPLNIEIKARCDDHEYVRKTLLSHDADFKGEDRQIDTYFTCANGRLKLREGNIENHLIHYEREDKEGPKRSDVTLYPVMPGASLKGILEKALGVLAVIDKRREIYFIGNVKFHIDTVRGLGTFVEIEAIDKDGTIGIEQLQAQCDEYMRILKIDTKDLLKDSYSDMLLRA